MKHRILPLFCLWLVACGSDSGDDLDPVCSAYCSEVCARMVECNLTSDAGDTCRTACRTEMQRARMAEQTCNSMRVLGTMDCDPLEGWTVRWLTERWHLFPDYGGSLIVSDNTCWPTQNFNASFTMELFIDRAQLTFHITSQIVGMKDQDFQDACQLEADGSCDWVYPYELWPRGDNTCIFDKTDSASLVPSATGITGTIGLHDEYKSGDCDGITATLPCDLVWDINGTITP